MWIVFLNNYKCYIWWELVRPSCHIKTLDFVCLYLEQSSSYNQSHHTMAYFQMLMLQKLFHTPLKKVVLKIRNPQTFWVEGRSHATHARIVLMIVKHVGHEWLVWYFCVSEPLKLDTCFEKNILIQTKSLEYFNAFSH